jgi:hypothetical protein
MYRRFEKNRLEIYISGRFFFKPSGIIDINDI